MLTNQKDHNDPNWRAWNYSKTNNLSFFVVETRVTEKHVGLKAFKMNSFRNDLKIKKKKFCQESQYLNRLTRKSIFLSSWNKAIFSTFVRLITIPISIILEEREQHVSGFGNMRNLSGSMHTNEHNVCEFIVCMETQKHARNK